MREAVNQGVETAGQDQMECLLKAKAAAQPGGIVQREAKDVTQSEALINTSIALSDEITGVAERLENIANRIVGLAVDIPVEQDITEPSATFVDRMVGQHDVQKGRLVEAREALDRIEKFIV